jgi:hypothetical protein
LGDSWKERARRELLDRRDRSGTWGYRAGGVPGVEPTVLSALALIASERDSSSAADRATSQNVGAWLATIQREDGSIPVPAGPAMPGWATPHALLLWAELGGFQPERRRAREWVLRLEGRPILLSTEARARVGHDPTLIGWPWVAGTHSWLEPTAMAILALCREGLGNHPRVRRGISLILDRAIPGGGWNYGNKAIFDRALRPLPGPTGIALLALAARGASTPVISVALNYLHGSLPKIRAAVSLGWGILALRAYRACPTAADSWLEESFHHCTGRPDATLGLALLLLAASEGGWEFPSLLEGEGGRRPDGGSSEG